ncbi:hypothetical protein AG1IA_09342 [Rhizoctonia solani AG-1 IA]|uniref:Uncharacterized protein n=1 Tax=Thanatephorus cucumeris (strain AG1-IA) TaxID=983506 RepID=L8WF76_THACA|nr:hypothetical protein AG1IA_09342 [Rhizoctonia solani AG-1 IA]
MLRNNRCDCCWRFILVELQFSFQISPCLGTRTRSAQHSPLGVHSDPPRPRYLLQSVGANVNIIPFHATGTQPDKLKRANSPCSRRKSRGSSGGLSQGLKHSRDCLLVHKRCRKCLGRTQIRAPKLVDDSKQDTRRTR